MWCIVAGASTVHHHSIKRRPESMAQEKEASLALSYDSVVCSGAPEKLPSRPQKGFRLGRNAVISRAVHCALSSRRMYVCLSYCSQALAGVCVARRAGSDAFRWPRTRSLHDIKTFEYTQRTSWRCSIASPCHVNLLIKRQLHRYISPTHDGIPMGPGPSPPEKCPNTIDSYVGFLRAVPRRDPNAA